MPKCDFNKVANNFIEIILWHGCFPVNLLRISRTRFPRNNSGELVLIEASFHLFPLQACV